MGWVLFLIAMSYFGVSNADSGWLWSLYTNGGHLTANTMSICGTICAAAAVIVWEIEDLRKGR
jgi:hypothetical protein